jgi:transcriptional regulator with XRE-family HTH domain
VSLLAPAVEQVREAVRERGLTLDEVARRSSVHRRTVKRLLDGERLNEATLRRVAAAVGVQLGLDDPDTEERARVRALVREEIALVREETRGDTPVTSRKEAAVLLGVHRRTLCRRAGSDKRRWWASSRALRVWWEQLLQRGGR